MQRAPLQIGICKEMFLLMLFKHPYLNLDIGLIKEYFTVVKRADKKVWEERGFKKIHKYPIFRYAPKPFEIIMLGIPSKVEAFGIEALKSSRIIDVSTCCGTYGMGGPGFFGLKLHGEYGIRWLNYCIWCAGEHILYDDRVLECHPDFADKYDPVISYDDYSNTLVNFRNLLSDMMIKEIVLLKESIEIILIDSHNTIHSIKSFKYSDKFPEQGGTRKKRNSYESGEMKDYWFVTYDGAHLKV